MVTVAQKVSHFCYFGRTSGIREGSRKSKSRVLLELAMTGLAVLFLTGQAASAQVPSPVDQPDEPSRPVPETDDPAADGWESEVFSNLAEDQLERIGKLLIEPSEIIGVNLRAFITQDFSSTPLLPQNLRTVFEDRAITVKRWSGPADTMENGETHRGADGLGAALTDLATLFEGATDIRFEAKIFRARKGEDGETTTEQYITVSGLHGTGSVEQHSTWKCLWTKRESQPPLLKSISLTQYEQARVRSVNQVLFSDCTEAVVGHTGNFATQVSRGTFDWAALIEATMEIDMPAYQGLAVGDVNGDGLEDVYFCQNGGLPNRLLLQNADGTASDRSEWAGVDWLDRTRCALIVDLDNDGDEDLALGMRSGLMFLSNDGSGRFERRGMVPAAEQAFGLAAADYDLDGDLDVYVSRYMRPGLTWNVPNPVPYHDANNGPENFLLRNDADWKFTNVTVETGMDVDNRRWTLAASWEDYDQDGDPDLYVANDFGRNCLYRNDGGRFVNVAAEAGTEDMASGMSTSWGDFNRDGWMDLLVGNMWSSAGGRITYHPQFQPGSDRSTKVKVQRLARGNSLFANNADGTFSDVSVDSGVTMGRWAWSSVFSDLNNDGWEDLVVTNGFVSAPDTGDL